MTPIAPSEQLFITEGWPAHHQPSKWGFCGADPLTRKLVLHESQQSLPFFINIQKGTISSHHLVEVEAARAGASSCRSGKMFSRSTSNNGDSSLQLIARMYRTHMSADTSERSGTNPALVLHANATRRRSGGNIPKGIDGDGAHRISNRATKRVLRRSLRTPLFDVTTLLGETSVQ